VTTFLAAYPRMLRLASPPGVARRIVIRISVFCTVLTALGLVPLFKQVIRPAWSGNADQGLLATMILLPIVALVTAVLPFAMTVGVDAIRGEEGWPPQVERSVATRLVLATTLWMFVGGGWIIPALNHAWRTSVVTSAGADGTALPRGARDLSTGELLLAAIRPPHTISTVGGWVITDRLDQLATRELAMRLLLVALPCLVAWLRFQALEDLRQRTLATARRPLPLSVGIPLLATTLVLMLQVNFQSGLPYPLPLGRVAPAMPVVVMLLTVPSWSAFKRKINQAR
jgi:hypothetical protein